MDLITLCLVLFGVYFFNTILLRTMIKKSNPNHSLFDDILIFTGGPVFIGYLVFLLAKNGNEPFYEDKELSLVAPMVLVSFSWTIISLIIVFKRNAKSLLNR